MKKNITTSYQAKRLIYIFGRRNNKFNKNSDFIFQLIISMKYTDTHAMQQLVKN